MAVCTGGAPDFDDLFSNAQYIVIFVGLPNSGKSSIIKAITTEDIMPIQTREGPFWDCKTYHRFVEYHEVTLKNVNALTTQNHHGTQHIETELESLFTELANGRRPLIIYVMDKVALIQGLDLANKVFRFVHRTFLRWGTSMYTLVNKDDEGGYLSYDAIRTMLDENNLYSTMFDENSCVMIKVSAFCPESLYLAFETFRASM